MRRQTKIIIALCFIVLAANLVSVIYSSICNLPINSIDVLSILVTIILGVSTIIQAEQENKKMDYQNKLQIQNNMPYLQVEGMERYRIVDKGWTYKDVQAIDKGIVDDPLRIKEDKIFMLSVDKGVGFNIDFNIQNISDSLISYIKVGGIKDNNFYENEYKNGVQRCIDDANKYPELQKTIESLKKQSYEKLFTNDITNINRNEKKDVSVTVKFDQFKNNVHDIIVEEKVPDALIFNIRFYIYSVVGIWYQQDVELGLRAEALYKWNNPKQLISDLYKIRYAYVLEKCVSNVKSMKDDEMLKKLNKELNIC